MGRPLIRAAACALACAASVLALAGCGLSDTETSSVDPVQVARALPTPDGLRDTAPARAAGVAATQAALAGIADPGGVKALLAQGFRRAAVRRWTGAGGRGMTVVVSVWDTHLDAENVGAGAAELPLGSSGARAWTPQDLPGSRGARVDRPGQEIRTLSWAEGPVSLFVRTTGGVPDDVPVRSVERMRRIVLGR